LVGCPPAGRERDIRGSGRGLLSAHGWLVLRDTREVSGDRFDCRRPIVDRGRPIFDRSDRRAIARYPHPVGGRRAKPMRNGGAIHRHRAEIARDARSVLG
jgi:hypothetical protein